MSAPVCPPELGSFSSALGALRFGKTLATLIFLNCCSLGALLAPSPQNSSTDAHKSPAACLPGQLPEPAQKASQVGKSTGESRITLHRSQLLACVRSGDARRQGRLACAEPLPSRSLCELQVVFDVLGVTWPQLPVFLLLRLSKVGHARRRFPPCARLPSRCSSWSSLGLGSLHGGGLCMCGKIRLLGCISSAFGGLEVSTSRGSVDQWPTPETCEQSHQGYGPALGMFPRGGAASVTDGSWKPFWRLCNILACVSRPHKDLHIRALVFCLLYVFEMLHGLWGRFARFSQMPGERPGNVTGNFSGSPPPL